MSDPDKMNEAPPPAYNEMPQPIPAYQGQQPIPAYQGQQPIFHHPQYANPTFTPPGGTTVIINQPTTAGAPGAAPRMWSTGICAMCDDMGICCCGLFCGLWLSCSVSSDMGESCCVPFLVPAAEITLRTKWRTQENIEGSILNDCLTVWCCGPCAMCQLAREVKARKTGTLRPRQ